MILITGGAGYIGSFVTRKFQSAHDDICVVDNLSNGFRASLAKETLFYQIDLCDFEKLNEIFSKYQISAIIHLAAKASVEESVHYPELYYHNNVLGLKNLLKCCEQHKIQQIIFASSGTVYGNVKKNGLLNEDDPVAPINPYGETKLIGENLLKAHAQINQHTAVTILRFFNVVGACADATLGQQNTKYRTHLLHKAAAACFAEKKEISIYGHHYQTPDGTAVRDYIHVEDLADIIEAIYRYNLKYNFKDKHTAQKQFQILNCSYGQGYSVKEVLTCFQKESKVLLNLVEKPNRPGDPDYLVGDPTKLKSLTGWQPLHDRLDHICRTTYLWELKTSLSTSR